MALDAFATPVISGLFALAGAAAGNYITYRLNERTRRLDLYKQVYPEKVKAAQALLTAADTLYQKSVGYALSGDPNDEELRKDILTESTSVHIQSTNCAWLLGPQTKKLGIELVTLSRKVVYIVKNNKEVEDWLPATPEIGGTGKYEQVYLALSAEVRRQLHLDALEALLPKS